MSWENIYSTGLGCRFAGISRCSRTLKISAWHGFNLELLMTVGVVIFGTFLYKTIKRWIGLYKKFPQRFTLNHLYDQSLIWVETLGRHTTNRYMTGSLRHYFLYIFGFFIILLTGSLLNLHGIHIDITAPGSIGMYEIGLAIGMVGAALTVLLTNHRITAIVALGALGYMVAMFFVIFRAPDLGLTQMVVETVTTVLFLLSFYYLPKLRKRMDRLSFKLSNFIISVGVGLTVTVIGLSAFGHKLFEPITSFLKIHMNWPVRKIL